MFNDNMNFVHLWIGAVYDIDDHWDRLRAIGSAKDLGLGISKFNFFSVRQRIPALSEKTRPEMKDPSTAQILAEYNTISNLCELFNTTRYCFDILDEDAQTLGNNLKYLLRMSNITYPHLFDEIDVVPAALSQIGQKISPIYQGKPILDIQAYDDKILISGGPIGRPEDWPDKHLVEEVDYHPNGFNFRGFVGKDIIVPAKISDQKLGNLVLTVWKAKKNSLEDRM